MDVPEEKPYEFVPFPEGDPQRETAIGHHQFVTDRLSGQLILRLTARRPVQVASGGLDVMKTKTGEEAVAQDVTIKRAGKTVHVLPGSSFKGVLRSVVEALSPSCVQVLSRKTRRAVPSRLSSCKNVTKLCPACRLFGMTGRGQENYLGQVQVRDALPIKSKMVYMRTPLLWKPARSRKAEGRKLYYHGTAAKGPDIRLAAGTGSIFEVQIDFSNLTRGELGLLLIALGQHPKRPFLLKVGAAKPVGLGSVQVEVIRVTLAGEVRHSGRAGAGTKELEAKELEQHIGKWVAAAEKDGLVDKEALPEVWKILREENLSRPSPEGVY